MAMLNKKELSKIPLPAPFPTQGMYSDKDRLLTTEELVCNGTQVFILNFHIQEGESLVCSMRTFLCDSDYITQDFTEGKPKWRTSSLANDCELWGKNLEFLSMEHRERLSRFLKRVYHPPVDEAEEAEKLSIWGIFRQYQLNIMSIRLDKKYQHEKELIDQKMETLGEIPQKFYDWVGKTFPNFLYYKSVGKSRHKITCQCTSCGSYEADRRVLHVKHNAEGTCPKCGKPVTFKAFGISTSYHTESKCQTYIDPLPNGICARFFYSTKVYKKDGNDIKIDTYCRETVREFLQISKSGKIKNSCFEFDNFHRTGDYRWCKYKKHGTFIKSELAVYLSCLYTGNLPDAFGKLPARNFCLERLANKIPDRPLRYFDAIGYPEQAVGLEHLLKADLTNLATYILSGEYRAYFNRTEGINLSGTTLKDVLRLNRHCHPNRKHIAFLKDVNATWDELKFVQMCDRYNVPYTKDVMRQYLRIFGVTNTPMLPENRHASLYKICKYMEAVEAEYGGNIRNISKDWLDYLNWCKDLHYDLNRPCYYFPKNLKTAHDRTLKEYNENYDKICAEKRMMKDAKAAQVMAKAALVLQGIFHTDGNIFHISGNEYVLVVPNSAEDVRAEGKALNHCVRTYVDKIAQNQTMIYFIRKADAVTTPFYTLEFKNGVIEQCRGIHNADMTEGVKNFVNSFQKKMDEAAFKKKPSIA